MAKANTDKGVVEGLLEKYNSTEDSVERSKLRRQLRKAGYYLSKQGGDTPAVSEKHPIVDHPAVQDLVSPKKKVVRDGGGIIVSIKKDGKVIEGFVIPSGTTTLTIELN